MFTQIIHVRNMTRTVLLKCIKNWQLLQITQLHTNKLQKLR